MSTSNLHDVHQSLTSVSKGRTRFCKSCKFTCTDAKEFLHHQTYAHSQEADVNESLKIRRKSTSLPAGTKRKFSITDFNGQREATLDSEEKENKVNEVLSHTESESKLLSSRKKNSLDKNFKIVNSDLVTQVNNISNNFSEKDKELYATDSDMDEPDSEQLYILHPDTDEGEDEGRLIIATDEDATPRSSRQPTRSGNIQNRTYVCNICEFSSTSAKIFLHHQKDAHNLDITIYECDICEYATKYKQKLPRHRKLHFTGKDMLLSGSDLDSSFGDRSYNHTDDRDPDMGQEEEEEEQEEEENEEDDTTPVTMVTEHPEVPTPQIPEQKKKRKTRQEVDPAKYFEVYDEAGVKYACSKCGNVYKWRKSLNKHWKEKHFGDIPDNSRPPPGLAKLNTIDRVKYHIPSSMGYDTSGHGHMTLKSTNAGNFRPPSRASESVARFQLPEQPSGDGLMSSVVMPKFIGPFITNTLFSPKAMNRAQKGAQDKNDMPMDLSGSGKKMTDNVRKPNNSLLGMQLKTEPQLQSEYEHNNNNSSSNYNHKQVEDMEVDKVSATSDPGNPILQCNRCGFVAKTLVDYSSHMTLHLNKRAFKCAECQEHFNGLDELNRHFLQQHVEKISEHKEAIQKIPHGLQQTYHLLQMPLNAIGSMSNGEMASREPKYLKCSMCSFVAKWPAELQKHAVSHSEERPFVCMVCGSTYKWKWDLVKHFEKSHSSLPNPYKRREQSGPANASPSGGDKSAATPPPHGTLPGEDNPEMYEHVSGQVMSSTAAALLDASPQSHIRKIPFVTSLDLEPVRKKRRLSDTDAADDDIMCHTNGLRSDNDDPEDERPSSEPSGSKVLGQRSTSESLRQLEMSTTSSLRDIQNLIPPDEEEDRDMEGSPRSRDESGLKRKTQDEIKGSMAMKLKNASLEAGKNDTLLPYKCNMCEYRARWPSEITQHMKNHSDEKPYGCPRCSYRSKWKWDVVKHMKRCGGGTIKDVVDMNKLRKMPPPNVTVLPQGLMSQTNKFSGRSSPDDNSSNGYEGMMMNEDSGDSQDEQKYVLGLYQCHECPFIGNSPAELKRHMVMHSESKPFTCTMCGYSSRWKCDLKKHMKTYNHYDPNAAMKQGTMAQSPMFLQDKFRLESMGHDSQDSNDKHFKKSLLGNHFGSNGETNSDRSGGNSKLKCKQCEYQAEDLSSFLQHKKSHTSNTASPSSDLMESSQEQVSNRTRDKHRRKPLQHFRCLKCPYTSIKRTDLLLHEAMHRNQDMEGMGCLYCDYNESNKGSLLQHMRLHPEFDESECLDFLKAVADTEEYREEDEFPNDGDSDSFMMDDTSREGSESGFITPRYQEFMSESHKNGIQEPRSYQENPEDLSSGALDLSKPDINKTQGSGRVSCEWCGAKFPNIVTAYQHAKTVHPLEIKAQEMGETFAPSPKPLGSSQTINLLKSSPSPVTAHQNKTSTTLGYKSQLFNHTFNPSARYRHIEPKPVTQPNIQNIPTPTGVPSFVGKNLVLSKMGESFTPGSPMKPKVSPQPSPAHQQQQMKQHQLLQHLKAKKSISPNRRGRSFQCTKCSFTAPNAVTYLRHIERHGSNCRHTCRFCDYSIDRLNLLYQHMKGTHGDLWRGTPEEKINLTSSSSKHDEQKLKMALYYAEKGEGGLFDGFDEEFDDSLNSSGSSGEFKSHLESMGSKSLPFKVVVNSSGKRSYQCPKCAFHSNSLVNVTSHLRQHGYSKRFQCNYCDYSGENLKSINNHLEMLHLKEVEMTEPGKQPFSIQYDCSMEENNNSIMWGEDDYYSNDSSSVHLPTCTKCPYKCGTVEALQEHISQHGGHGNLSCNFCDFRVDEQEELVKHLSVHSLHYTPDIQPEEISQDASLCNGKQKDLIDLVQKEKSRIEGGEEGIRRLDANNLRSVLSRMKKNGERLRYRCAKCPYFSFCKNNIVKHRKQHLIRSQYVCKMCDYSATRAFLLNQHCKFHSQEIDSGTLTGTFHDIILDPYDKQGAQLLRSTETQTSDKTAVSEEVEEEMEDEEKDFSDEAVDDSLASVMDEENGCDDEFDEDEMASLERAEYEKYQLAIKNKKVEKSEFDNLSMASDESLAEIDPSALQEQISLKMSAAMTTEEKIRYTCPQCPYKCNALRSFKCHIHMHGLNRKYVCDHCNWSADRLNLLYQHRKVHSGLPTYDPNPEDIVFLNREFALEIDSGIIEDLSHQKCLPGEEQDDSQKGLSNSKNAALKKTYACKVCPFTCTNKNSFDYHRNFHGVNAKYTCQKLDLRCPKCPFTAQSSESMDAHQKCHGSSQEHACPLCDYSVDSPSALAKHQTVHMLREESASPGPSQSQPEVTPGLITPQLYFKSQGEAALSDQEGEETPKDLKCQRCPYGTPSKSELSDHEHQHKKALQHGCPYCDFSCKGQNELLPHVQLHLPSSKVTLDMLQSIVEKKGKLGDKGLESPEVAVVTTSNKSVDETEETQETQEMEEKTEGESKEEQDTDSAVTDVTESNPGETTPEEKQKSSSETVKTNRVFVCPYCEREFEDKALMLQHQKQHLFGSKY